MCMLIQIAVFCWYGNNIITKVRFTGARPLIYDFIECHQLLPGGDDRFVFLAGRLTQSGSDGRVYQSRKRSVVRL